MAKVNSYPTATVEDADLILGWDNSASRVIAPALTAWRAALITGAASTIATAALTASRALASNGSGKVDVATTTTTELQGLHGLTASRAIATDGSGILTPSATTATELGYVNGVTSAIQTQLNAVNFRPVINLLGNGHFPIWDLGATPTATDNAYFVPGWRYLTDATSNRAASQGSTSPPSGSRYYVSFDGSVAAGNPSVGCFFVIKADDAIPLQDKIVRLLITAKANGTDGTQVVGIVASWTGSADATTGDPISSWGTMSPTLAAGWTIEAGPTNLSIGTGWTTASMSATLDTASIKNIGVLIFGYPNTLRGRWDLAQVQLSVGTTQVNFVPRPIQEERNFLAKHNYAATGAPAVSDDITAGYALGSNWINVTADDHYICLDCAAGAAVWKKTTP